MTQSVLQTPGIPPSLVSDHSLAVYTFIETKSDSDELPEKFVMTVNTNDGPLVIDLDYEKTTGDTIHTLAARSLIKDLERGTSYLHKNPISPSSREIEWVRIVNQTRLRVLVKKKNDRTLNRR